MRTTGVVSAGDPQTVEAGLEILRAGGNAIDAVVAAACAAFVVEPPLGTPAGGGVLLHGGPQGHEILDFFTVMPGIGLPPVDRSELDFYGIQIDYGPTVQEFHIGRGSVAVPTVMLGLLQAHRDGGSLPLGEVVAPAIQYARNGYTLSPHVRTIFGLLEPILLHSPAVARLHGDGSQLAAAGDQLTNPGLADFLEEIARGGRDFFLGPFTDDLLAVCGSQAGGRLTREDLVRWTPTKRAPLAVDLGSHGTFLTNGPPSSGGTLIGLSLKLAEHLGLGAQAFLGPEHLRLVAKIFGGVSAARNSGFDDAIWEPDRALAYLKPDAIQHWADAALSAAEERHLGQTTHISVTDDSGRYASLTMSNGEGCGVALEPWGIHLNNLLGEADINPLGFHVAPAGSPLTTMMSPSCVWHCNRPRVVIGSGGSNRIRTAIAQALFNHLFFEQPLEVATNAPRLHVEGEHLWFEAQGLVPAATEALRADWPAHVSFENRSMFFGGVHATGWDEHPIGGADSRRGGLARST